MANYRQRITYNWFVLVSMSFWTVKSWDNEKIFVPHPPHTVFFSVEFMDSLRHISGVLTLPMLSIFKGAAPSHWAKKKHRTSQPSAGWDTIWHIPVKIYHKHLSKLYKDSFKVINKMLSLWQLSCLLHVNVIQEIMWRLQQTSLPPLRY